MSDDLDLELFRPKRWPVDHSDNLWWSGQTRVREWWMGKPWRRLELSVNDHMYRGERVDRDWTFTVTVGLRRIGLHFHWGFTWARGADYSDEEHQ